jgi:SAM-dependent methyltransferase
MTARTFTLFPDLQAEWQGFAVATTYYKQRVHDLVKPGMSILHAGCGRDKNNVTRPFANDCWVVGVDTDPNVEFHGALYHSPLEYTGLKSTSFDLICCEYVIEHVDDPAEVFQEFRRLLKPNGKVVILTPNLLSYKGLAAVSTPQWFHHVMGRRRYGPDCEKDMYPTRYRCNTAMQLRRVAKRSGFKVEELAEITNGPSWLPWLPGLNGYHKLIQRYDWLGWLRCAIVVELGTV